MYSVREAFTGFRRSPYMVVISIGTITITLIMLGVFVLGTWYANGIFQRLKKSEEINVYLDDSLADEDMLALDAVIATMQEVESTRILSKQDAAREFMALFGDDLISTLGENPLPRTIVVSMADEYRTMESIEHVADRARQAEGVESVEFGSDWMSRLDILFMGFVLVELVLSGLIVFASVLIISNTITLTIIARRDTIDIMRLVGATDRYIRRPFYLEGAIQGVLAGVVAFLLMIGAYFWLRYALPDLQFYLYMFSMPTWELLNHQWSVALLVPLGGFMGFIGSFIAVRRAM